MAPADFSGTIIMVNEPNPRVMGMPVRSMLYQNKRRNLNGGRPNAMLLHIDAAVPMGPQNFVDTTNFPGIANDMVTALQGESKGLMLGGDLLITRGEVQVFDVGSYTVVLATDARDLTAALLRVPLAKRPAINPELFNFYAHHFPHHSVALCCFTESSEVTEPMMFWWQPRDASHFTMPALDEHTGQVPVPGEPVQVDHWLIAGSYQMPLHMGQEVEYEDERYIPQQVRSLLPDYVIGCHVSGYQPNGDFTMPTQALLSQRGSIINPRDIQRLIPRLPQGS